MDLGSTSIGWAIIEENSVEVLEAPHEGESDKIVAIGSRIIPLTTDESTQFSKGQALTKNADRTAKRTQRKGYDRYQLRRTLLLEELKHSGIYDGAPMPLDKLALWGLRAKAVSKQISLSELGRVLCHINQKRGYRTAKSDFGDKKLGAHVQQVVDRYREIREKGLTVGQFMYESLKTDDTFRCKDRTYPRLAYIEEYDAIMACQMAFYPDVLTSERIAHIRDYIIFHQRPLKSCKHLVGRCELERCDVVDENSGRVRNQGPKVAPRTSPLFQACKIWESINNLNINNKVNDTLHITLEQKQRIYDYMRVNEKLTSKELAKILGVKPTEWFCGKAVGKGLQGDTTYFTIKKALGDYPKASELLRFNLKYTDGNKVNTETGEITKVVDASFEREPLYQLWHVLYSISDIDELHRLLRSKFGIEDKAVIEALCQIDFVKAGYGNKSSRAMRKILPYLQDGMQYSAAKIAAGYDDITLTKEQNEARQLAEKLLPIQKGELRQPVVEKILNQLVNLVNALMIEYGRFDEIRVELARELKQNREERESATREIARNQKVNETIAKRIQDEYGLASTRSRIQKYKMWEESEHICMYCGNAVNVKEFLLGFGVEVEHIIPRSVLFDDSFSNKVCACRACNKEKNNRTAYDYMKSKDEDGKFEAYVARVNDLADRYNPKLPIPIGISKSKRNKLLMSAKDIPSDFIERQLRESQYIAKKAKEILQSICHNVYATSGSVTDFIRHIWGWDEVLHSLNFERYQAAGLTEMVERDVNGEKVKVECIKGWSKRMDHRHHAVDALTIACTKQGYIQRINNLNSLKETALYSYGSEKQGEETKQRLTRLERYIQQQPHFSTAEVESAIEGIAVSFKGGKRAASVGKRYIRKGGKRICVQSGIIVPRGALSEGSVYGHITNSETGKGEYVIKYGIASFFFTQNAKKPDVIIDKNIRNRVIHRLEQLKSTNKQLLSEPLLDHQGRVIRSVRCRAKLDKGAEPIRYNAQNKPIAFVNTGSNYCSTIYIDHSGEWKEHISTFWHAVERKKYGIPYIIKDLASTWEKITDDMPESFVNQLPESATWKFKFSMQQNEMFILGLDEELYQDAIRSNNYALLCKYLYRVQTISKNDYRFRHHLETTVDDESSTAKEMGKMKRLSLNGLKDCNPHKVHISVTGKITEI